MDYLLFCPRHVTCTETDYGCSCLDPCDVCQDSQHCSSCLLPACNTSVTVEHCATNRNNGAQTTDTATVQSPSTTSTSADNMGGLCVNLTLCEYCTLCDSCTVDSCGNCDLDLCSDVEVDCTCRASLCESSPCDICRDERCTSPSQSTTSSPSDCVWDWGIRALGDEFDVAYHVIFDDLYITVCVHVLQILSVQYTPQFHQLLILFFIKLTVYYKTCVACSSI